MSNIRTIADEPHEAFLDRFPVTASTLGFPGRDHLPTDHGEASDEAFAAVLRGNIDHAPGEAEPDRAATKTAPARRGGPRLQEHTPTRPRSHR